jgi:hypothetical protein
MERSSKALQIADSSPGAASYQGTAESSPTKSRFKPLNTGMEHDGLNAGIPQWREAIPSTAASGH